VTCGADGVELAQHDSSNLRAVLPRKRATARRRHRLPEPTTATRRLLTDIRRCFGGARSRTSGSASNASARLSFCRDATGKLAYRGVPLGAETQTRRDLVAGGGASRRGPAGGRREHVDVLARGERLDQRRLQAASAPGGSSRCGRVARGRPRRACWTTPPPFIRPRAPRAGGAGSGRPARRRSP
jgi:hypothetical protein